MALQRGQIVLLYIYLLYHTIFTGGRQNFFPMFFSAAYPSP